MDNTECGSKYPSKGYTSIQQSYSSLHQFRLAGQDAMYSRTSDHYPENKVDGEDERDEELGEGGVNGVRMIGKDSFDAVDDDDDDDDDDNEDDDEDDDDDDDDEEDEDDGIGNARPKKRKLKNLVSRYEFAPRVPAPPPTTAQQAPPSRPASGGRSSGSDWTEHETFALLKAWGDRFLELGRKSLRTEEWQEVAEKVSQETNIERTNVQCRNRLDTLKKKYKKEKTRLAASGGGSSRWPFYRKMDMLMYSPPQQRAGLSCGIDSGEYVFMNPKDYLNKANGLDEMGDSPGNSESSRDEEEDSDALPPKGKRNRGQRVNSSFRLLANSVQKFSKIYEKIEVNKRKQMVELENMRMVFHKQLEMQRRQILERAQAEIAKIRQGEDDDENDDSAENLSG